MTLRPYQLEALQTSRDKYQAGVTRQLIALPTGTGKTPLFACVRSFFGFKKRVMVLVHREELASQAADKLRSWNPGAAVGVEMGDLSAGPGDLFVVASVQTLGRAGSRRIERFKPEHFDAVICDEAHHSTAPSYRNIFQHFGLHVPGCQRLLLGVTATPSRGDGVPLAEVYDEIIYQMSILDAIKNGWLVDLRGIRIRTKSSLDRVRTQAGDFQIGDLVQCVNTPERNDLIVREWLKHGQDRQTVVFTADIAHAQHLAAMFKNYGIAAEAVWGDDPLRADKLRFHREKGLRVLCNCGVLTEGYDDPNIGCIVMARPTKSGLLFVQMAGRGTRLPQGIQNLGQAREQGLPIIKEDCILMDVVDNTTRHSLVTLTSIFGLGNRLDLNGKRITEAVKRFEAAKNKAPQLDLTSLADNIEQLEATVETAHLFEVKYPQEVLDNSPLQWNYVAAENAFVLRLLSNETLVITAPDLLGDRWVVGSINGNKFKEKAGADLPQAFKLADGLVTTFAREQLNIVRREGGKWMEDKPTDKQIAFMKRLRIPIPPGITKGQASQKINQALARKAPQAVW